MTQKQSASTVEKAIQLLLAFSAEGREIGTSDLGRKLGIHKATVSRILLKLAEYNFVYKSKETRKYSLGAAVYQLAMNVAENNFNEIMKAAIPHVTDLRDEIQETVSLEIWLGNSTVPTFQAQPDKSTKVQPCAHASQELHAASGCKAILAYTHTDRVNVLLGGELTQLTENTITDKDLFRQKLVAFNKQGFATDIEESHKGVCTIAAPVFDHLRKPVAALVIMLPSSKTSQLLSPDLIAKLKSKANRISSHLSVSSTLIESEQPNIKIANQK